VLLVEDDPVNAAVAEGYLAALGCTSVWVKNGADAIARSASERFDVVLMDLNVPDMDGFAATALIREREREGARRTPIVALTAHDVVRYREKVLKADMDDILSKPCSLKDCARLLGRWLPATPVDALPGAALAPAASDERASAAPPGDSLTSVDAAAVSTLRKIRGGQQPDLYSRLVTLYQAASASSLARLRAAIDNDDFNTAASICHKFAASAANVGALAYSKRLRELEKLCRDGIEQSARELHETLQAAHPALLESMLSLTPRATA
jgi:two-component system sensor histidine kinase/response regulator